MAAGALVACALGFAGGCAGTTINARGDAASLLQNVTTVVVMPPRLDFAKPGEQRRVARRAGDTLIQATGGHAILAEELTITDPELIADSVRALGDYPEQTLTFSMTATRSDRVEAAVAPSVGGRPRPVRRFADYTVRLDVRRADRRDIVGSIETIATCYANTPEIDAEGRPAGLQRAIDDAIRQGVKAFAPRLTPGEPLPALVEVPPSSGPSVANGALAAIDKLSKLQVLYPELSLDDLAFLASSNARFLVVKPGRLAALGLAKGDLLRGVGGQGIGGRAALARTLARGATPALSIDRAGGHFLVGPTLVAGGR